MAEFFLSDAKFLELCAAYAAVGNPGPSEVKGIVILASGICRVVGVKGRIPRNGRVDEISGSAKNPCPYPPPCKKDANGECLTDEKGNLILDTNNSDAKDFL